MNSKKRHSITFERRPITAFTLYPDGLRICQCGATIQAPISATREKVDRTGRCGSCNGEGFIFDVKTPEREKMATHPVRQTVDYGKDV